MEMDEFLSVERYFNALRESFLIDLINVSDFYNKDIYDFYFIIEDTSKNWAKKLILKKITKKTFKIGLSSQYCYICKLFEKMKHILSYFIFFSYLL